MKPFYCLTTIRFNLAFHLWTSQVANYCMHFTAQTDESLIIMGNASIGGSPHGCCSGNGVAVLVLLHWPNLYPTDALNP
jgi:hypothetical protein